MLEFSESSIIRGYQFYVFNQVLLKLVLAKCYLILCYDSVLSVNIVRSICAIPSSSKNLIFA